MTSLEISKHLLAALRIEKMTQKTLSDKLGLSPAYVNKLCKGTKTPSIELLDRICTALDLTPSEFFSCLSSTPSMQLCEREVDLIASFRGLYDYEQDVISEMVNSLRKKHLGTAQIKSFPITRSIDGYAAAGSPIFDPVFDNQIEIPSKYIDRDRFSVLEARGKSMEPEINSGDCVIVERFSQANQGCIALVHLQTESSDGEYTIKKFYNYGDRVELRSINADFPTMFYPLSSVISAERVVKVLHNRSVDLI